MKEVVNVLPREEVDKIIELHKDGYNIKQISEMVHRDRSAISRHLQENGFTISSARGSRLPQETVDEIIKLYLSGSSISDISRQIGVGRHTVSKYVNIYLHANGLERRNDFVHKYTVNEKYFDVIDTPNKAYVLGFLYADGNNLPSKGTISMALEENDKYILEKIRKEIDSDCPLVFLKQSERLGKNSPYNYKDLWCLKVYNSHMCRSLSTAGMVPNKSLVLRFPDWLDDDLVSHFVRGYFDGDGSIAKTGCITVTSTESFCETLLGIVKEFAPHAYITDASCKNGITRVLHVDRKFEAFQFCNWIYRDADIYLTRKYDRYLNLMEYCNSKTA